MSLILIKNVIGVLTIYMHHRKSQILVLTKYLVITVALLSFPC